MPVMKRLLYSILTFIIGFSSFAQTSSTEEAKYAAYLDSALTAELKSRREVDEFTDQISIDCPVLGNPLSTMHLIKNINKNKAVYYIDLMTQGSTVFVGWKGAILLFTDGTKLKKPNAKIDIEVSDYGYRYTAFIPLTQADMKVLSSKTIDKFRLSIFDGAVNSKDAGMFRIYAKNMIKLK
jgi:hypothetical protein